MLILYRLFLSCFLLPTAPADYQSIAQTLTFSSSFTSRQVTISIVDDDFAETNETFSALLTTNITTLILLKPCRVIINDNDGVYLCECTCT